LLVETPFSFSSTIFSNTGLISLFYRYDFWKGKVVEVPVHHKCIHEVFKYESDLDPWDIDENKI
jgi:hypothetical protein